MLNKYKQKLKNEGLLNGKLNKYLLELADLVPDESISKKMKLVIANSVLVSFTSHFRKHIQLEWDNKLKPISSISFVIAPSGASKDLTVYTIASAFKGAYENLEKLRKESAKAQAIDRAIEEGEEEPDNYSTYKKYYKSPRLLQIALSTYQGLFDQCTELEKTPLGSAYLYSGEFTTELAQSSLVMDNIKLISELYEDGYKEPSITRGAEGKEIPIKRMPVNVLFMGNRGNILFEDKAKKTFKTEFNGKLARRSIFCYIDKECTTGDFTSVSDEVNSIYTKQKVAYNKIIVLAKYFETIQPNSNPLTFSSKLSKLFILTKLYNNIVSKKYSKKNELAKVTQKHLQMKALKIAGAYAIIDKSEVIEVSHYNEALNFCQLFVNDIKEFEGELVKEPYQLLSDYLQEISVDNTSEISLHEASQLGFITTSGNLTNKLKELIILLTSYDKNNLYSIEGTNIVFEKLVRSSQIGVSVVEIDTTEIQKYSVENDIVNLKKAKIAVASTCVDGFEYSEEYNFEDLSELLSGEFDWAYNFLEFKDGIRGKNNTLGTTNILVLDVDDSILPYNMVHELLSEINHHICLTSNYNNLLKFRILIKCDSHIKLSGREWMKFTKLVSDYLALNADILPQSQICYSYKGGNRKVLSVTDKKDLKVRDFINIAKSTEELKFISDLSEAEKKKQIKDYKNTFKYGYNCEENYSFTLYKIAKHAEDLGMDYISIEHLILDIDDYHNEDKEWVQMDRDRIYATILEPLKYRLGGN